MLELIHEGEMIQDSSKDLLTKLKENNPYLYTIFLSVFILLNIVSAIYGMLSQNTLPVINSVLLLFFIIAMITILSEKDGVIVNVFKWTCMALTIFVFLLLAIYMTYNLYLEIHDPVISQEEYRNGVSKIAYVNDQNHYITRKSGTKSIWVENHPDHPEHKAELQEDAQDDGYLMMSRPSDNDQRIYVRIPLCGGSLEWAEGKQPLQDGDLQTNCKNNACWGSVGKVSLENEHKSCQFRRDYLKLH